MNSDSVKYVDVNVTDEVIGLETPTMAGVTLSPTV